MDKARKKEIITEYKQQKATGGVYRIRNMETGKSLIKADVNLEAVENRFNFSQKTNSCIMLKLQQDWNKYGSKVFVFEILKQIKIDNTESPVDFRRRLKNLEEEWKAKYPGEQLY